MGSLPADPPTFIRYILDEKSGPLLYYPKCHYELSFACLNYMNTNLCFIDRSYTENALQIRVVKGFHGLHQYANEFWFRHLLQYAKTNTIVEDEDLDDPLDKIQKFWKEAPGVAGKTLRLDDNTSLDSIKSQLEAMESRESMDQARKMGLDILTFRKFLSQENNSHQDPKSEYSRSCLRA